MEVPSIGADLSGVVDKFILWLLTDELPQYVKDFPAIALVISKAATLYQRKIKGESIGNEEWGENGWHDASLYAGSDPVANAAKSAADACKAAYYLSNRVAYADQTTYYQANAAAYVAQTVTSAIFTDDSNTISERMVDKLLDLMANAPTGD